MATQTWNIDPTHSAVRFSVRHLMISKVHGQFTRWNGVVELDDADPTRSSVKVEIEAASINTNEEKRDAHLRSPDFFDVEKFPTLTFVSKQVVAKAGKVTHLVGDLTIHGVTREVTLEVEDVGRSRDPWGNERVGYEASTKISRKDFGLEWNVALEAGGVLVGDKIEISLEVQAIAEQVVAKAS